MPNRDLQISKNKNANFNSTVSASKASRASEAGELSQLVLAKQPWLEDLSKQTKLNYQKQLIWHFQFGAWTLTHFSCSNVLAQMLKK